MFSFSVFGWGLSVASSCVGENLLFGPAPAKGFDELNGRNQALAGKLRVGALGLKRFAAGIHHFEVTDDTRTIAVGSQFGGPPRAGDRFVEGGLRALVIRPVATTGEDRQ